MPANMSPEQLSQWLAQRKLESKQDDYKDFVLLDVREEEEVAIASIPGSTWIPMGQITSRLLELDPEKPIVVLCHHGIRSFHVMCYLDQQDFDELYNLSGGIDAYSKRVDDSIPTY